MIMSYNHGKTQVVWQEREDGDPCEDALVVQRYHDVIGIEQRGDELIIDPATIPDLIKALRAAAKEEVADE